MDDFYSTAYSDTAKAGGHADADADNNKDLLDTTKGLEDFSVADFVDYIQTIANFRAVNGGTQSRLGYATRILEENQINLQAATSRSWMRTWLPSRLDWPSRTQADPSGSLHGRTSQSAGIPSSFSSSVREIRDQE